ncbi:NADP-dependent oxidoreductase domain-containing protein [Podospora didyma]|uniref:NADP-dependent oxidoreductase domain-containing protein n=1 Tax=Podospora didyma TaxID=330526 RepID=A0AAE0N4I3_9PEZI|nr:NADP-dependent oxidoreductase domain-containing protein [Podospora didyma]
MPLIATAPAHRVILGLMTFGTDESTGARVTDAGDFNKILDLFQSRGYNEVDTARVYVGGQQEAFTREANWKDRGLTLATKIKYPSEHGANVHDKVIESLDLSLKELGTDAVDILYLHAAVRPLFPHLCLLNYIGVVAEDVTQDRGTPFADTLSAIDKLHKAGKFVRFGISNFTAFEVAEIVLTCKYNNWVRPTVYQGMYNAITRNIEPELVPACRRYGLDIVVYNPIAGGLFSGKIKSTDMVPAEGRFSDAAHSGKMYRNRYFRDSTFRALQIIEAAVEKSGLTMIETALRWVVHHSALKVVDGNDGIIIGVSNINQLDDNLTNIEKGPLPEEVVKALDEAWAVSKADSVNYWHMDVKYGYDTREALFGPGAR